MNTHSFVQLTFQAVLATDGIVDFAIFTYNDPSKLTDIKNPLIGFCAGDRQRWANISVDSIDSTNVFRIDGKPLYQWG